MNNKMSKLKRKTVAFAVEYKVKAESVDYEFEIEEEIFI
jgi:hypothetical protein